MSCKLKIGCFSLSSDFIQYFKNIFALFRDFFAALWDKVRTYQIYQRPVYWKNLEKFTFWCLEFICNICDSLLLWFCRLENSKWVLLLYKRQFFCSLISKRRFHQLITRSCLNNLALPSRNNIVLSWQNTD